MDKLKVGRDTVTKRNTYSKGLGRKRNNLISFRGGVQDRQEQWRSR